MVHLTDGGSFWVFRVLLFHHTLIFLLLMQSSAGQSAVDNASQPIVAAVGDDTILPCYLETAVDATSMTLEWSRPDLEPRFVHVWDEGKDALADQNPSYKGRTSLFIDKLKRGDISLHLSSVELSDNGTYRCYVPKLNKESFVTLAVDDIPPGPPVYVVVLVVIAIIIAVVVAYVTKGKTNLSPFVEAIAEYFT